MWRGALQHLSELSTGKMAKGFSLLLLIVLVGNVEGLMASVVYSEGGGFRSLLPEQMYGRYEQEPLPYSIPDQWERGQDDERVPAEDYEGAVPVESPAQQVQLGRPGLFDQQSGEKTSSEPQQLDYLGEKLQQLAELSRSLERVPEYGPEDDVGGRVANEDAAAEPSEPGQQRWINGVEMDTARSLPNLEAQKPLIKPQKKGQSEFVEFIEPVHGANKLKHKEMLEKRVADYVRTHGDRSVSMISVSSNALIIAFVAMGCVLTVVGTAGGAYYYKNVRSARDDPFDDFTRYSPAGPGKLKRGKATSPSKFVAEKGDESLAYRAQLHQYQQSKQKIIGSEVESSGVAVGFNGCGGADDVISDKSDDDGVDLEHNFSVYEYPGLAPTGDVEVKNPNFVESTANRKQSND